VASLIVLMKEVICLKMNEHALMSPKALEAKKGKEIS